MMKVYSRRQLMMDTVAIKPYISNGLVFHLDGVDATTTSWVDRIGGVVFNMSNVVCDGKGVYFKGATSSYGHSSTTVFSLWSNSTIEVVIHKTQASGFVFQSIGNSIAYIGGADYVNYTHGVSHKRSAITGNMQLNKTITHSINNDIEFFNGRQYGFSSADTWGNQGNGTWLGIRAGNSYQMKGYIYQIRIYNRKLSATEILFNQDQDRKKYGIQF
jgi:hypothetical protein